MDWYTQIGHAWSKGGTDNGKRKEQEGNKDQGGAKDMPQYDADYNYWKTGGLEDNINPQDNKLVPPRKNPSRHGRNEL